MEFFSFFFACVVDSRGERKRKETERKERAISEMEIKKKDDEKATTTPC